MMPIIRITATPIEDGLCVKFYCNDSDTFHTTVTLLKQIIPVDLRTYDPDHKAWLIYDQECMMAWCSSLESFGEVLLDIPALPQGRTTVFDTLYVTPDAPIEVIKASYKALVRLHHPDLVGDGGHEQMVAINAAYNQIMGVTD